MAYVIFDVFCLMIFMFTHHLWVKENITDMRDIIKKRSASTKRRFNYMDKFLSIDSNLEGI